MFSTSLALFLGAVAVMADADATACVVDASSEAQCTNGCDCGGNVCATGGKCAKGASEDYTYTSPEEEVCNAIKVTDDATKKECSKTGECTYTGDCSSYLDQGNCKCIYGRANLTAEGAYVALTAKACEKLYGYVADLEVKAKKTCVAKCGDFTKDSCNNKLGCYFKGANYDGTCEPTCKNHTSSEAGEDADDETTCNTFAFGCQWVKAEGYSKGECKYVGGECNANNATDDDKCTEPYKTMCRGGKCTCDEKYELNVDDNVCKGPEGVSCEDNSHCSGELLCLTDVCGPKTETSGDGVLAQSYVEPASGAAPTSLVVLFVALFCSA